MGTGSLRESVTGAPFLLRANKMSETKKRKRVGLRITGWVFVVVGLLFIFAPWLISGLFKDAFSALYWLVFSLAPGLLFTVGCIVLLVVFREKTPKETSG
jgi:O-antigen/teichoic acid export membrane protein